MKFSTIFTATASLVATASAHGGVGTYTIGSEVHKGWAPYNGASGQKTIQRPYSTFDPLLLKDLSTVKIRCNNGGSTGSGVSANIAAGSKIKATWTQWTHAPTAIMVYMAKCPSSGCNSWDGAGKAWFKIDHAGLLSGTQAAGKWAGDTIMATLDWTSTIPASLAPGEYLIRHELLALHQRDNPQFYPECAQLKVTGSGTSSPPSSLLVSFPGAYSGTEPGVAFNIDRPEAKIETTYPIPGPAVWDGTGNAPPATGEPSTPEPVPEPTTLVTAVIPAPTAPSCEPVARYGQCGGKTYSGCTVCAEGSKCVANGEYYSQCM